MSGEKTEEPTAKRLRDARQKGQVFKSQDVNSTVLLIAIFGYIAIAWPSWFRQCKDLVLLPTHYYEAPFEDAAYHVMMGTATTFALISFPFLFYVGIVGIAVNFFQVGALLSFEAIKPDLKKLSPMGVIKKIFSVKNLVEFVKSNLKIVCLVVILYYVIRALIDPMVKLPFENIEAISSILSPAMMSIAINTCLVYVIFAVIDFFFQKRQHTQSLMMTKDEVKREYKEMEGDPMIKSKRRQLHQQMLQENMVQNTRKATVLITNPTHYAVALQYEEGKTPLPIVTAKGRGLLAQRMIKAAQDANIPIMQNVPLAHALYDQVELEFYIPSEMIEPVAEVLRWVMKMKKENEPS